MQPVVQPAVQPVVQPAASCIRGFIKPLTYAPEIGAKHSSPDSGASFSGPEGSQWR